ncbi:hypothetical protein ACFU7T_26195 [Streptomyces sp. NPDC057555]|uniref:hypothetical protein n=1 Tax=Streptomyces sp. NPDC057555 TaxID=3346166 RepID=UPI0036A77211
MAKIVRLLKRLRALLDVELVRFESSTVLIDGTPQYTYLRLSPLGLRAESLGKTGWAALKNLRGEVPSEMKHVFYTLFAVSTLAFVLGVGWSGR